MLSCLTTPCHVVAFLPMYCYPGLLCGATPAVCCHPLMCVATPCCVLPPPAGSCQPLLYHATSFDATLSYWTNPLPYGANPCHVVPHTSRKCHPCHMVPPPPPAVLCHPCNVVPSPYVSCHILDAILSSHANLCHMMPPPASQQSKVPNDPNQLTLTGN